MMPTSRPNDFRDDQLHPFQAMRIVDIQVENPTTKTFILDGTLAAEPGQFVMVWLPDHEDKPFSLVNDNPVTLTIAAIGALTQAIHRQQVGDRLWLRGPYGQGYQLPETPSAPLLLIGETYFVGSLLFLARRAKAAGRPVSAILLAPTPADLTAVGSFEALEIPVQPISDSAALATILPNYAANFSAEAMLIYGSGPADTLQTIADWGAANNVPTQLAWKARMKCGIGVCGSCELGTGWLTCVDGPVLAGSPFKPST